MTKPHRLHGPDRTKESVMPDEFDKDFWECRYRAHSGGHDGGGPNPTLVTEAGELAPGLALDAGCGHGADATWLASRGWQVTAVDVSSTALAHAREQAASPRNDVVASRIDWVVADFAVWSPTEECFDLVTSHYVHVPKAEHEVFLRRLAAAVAPGGSLLVVGHDASGLHGGTLGSAPEAYIAAVRSRPCSILLSGTSASPRPGLDRSRALMPRRDSPRCRPASAQKTVTWRVPP